MPKLRRFGAGWRGVSDMARETDTSKCPNCKGWAFEPETYPMQACLTCNGTGKKPAQGSLGAAK